MRLLRRHDWRRSPEISRSSGVRMTAHGGLLVWACRTSLLLRPPLSATALSRKGERAFPCWELRIASVVRRRRGLIPDQLTNISPIPFVYPMRFPSSIERISFVQPIGTVPQTKDPSGIRRLVNLGDGIQHSGAHTEYAIKSCYSRLRHTKKNARSPGFLLMGGR